MHGFIIAQYRMIEEYSIVLFTDEIEDVCIFTFKQVEDWSGCEAVYDRYMMDNGLIRQKCLEFED